MVTFFCRFPIKLLKLQYTNIVLRFFFFVKSEGGVIPDLPLIECISYSVFQLDLDQELGPFRLWKLSLTFCSLIFTIDIAKKRQPKALEWNSEFGWQVLEAKKYHTILLPCYLKMVHLHIHLYKKCIWTIFISIQRIEYHIYTPINMF